MRADSSHIGTQNTGRVGSPCMRDDSRTYGINRIKNLKNELIYL